MSWSTASGRKEIELRLRRIGSSPDESIDLAEGALLLAALDRPRVALERYFHHITLLQEGVRGLATEAHGTPSLERQAAILRQVLVDDFDYHGDQRTYDDLQNANLMRVIDRRRGLPVALGILYIATARSQGWAIAGLNFPGHFLLRLELGGQRLILDPFKDGAARGPAELRALIKATGGAEAELSQAHFLPVANREVLLRLQNNIKLRLLQQGQAEVALEILESMVMIAPGKAELWYEIGLVQASLSNLRAAVLALEQFLELGSDPGSLSEAARKLQEIKTRLN
ncbi:MAG: transglutaminase-like domain-containing protein [Pseudomonadota bacterium]